MKTSDRRIKWAAGVIGFVAISAAFAQTPPPLPPPAPKLPPELLRRPPVKAVPQDPLVNQFVQLPTNAVPAPAPTPLPLVPAAPPTRTFVTPPPTQPLTALAWDGESKEFAAKPGDTNASFTFNLTNISPAEVVINGVRTSCGCTVARLPQALPWPVGPGTNGPIAVNVNLVGKVGTVVKTITVDTSAGAKVLMVKVAIPAPNPVAAAGNMDRMRNAQIALADKQAVFKGDCAKCHAESGKGKSGQELYVAVCGICHDAAHRASMVPDLHALKHPTDAALWRKWIVSGKTGSLMPAFSQTEGGPLNDEQINSLVDYLTKTISGNAPTNASAQVSGRVESVSAFPAQNAK